MRDVRHEGCGRVVRCGGVRLWRQRQISRGPWSSGPVVAEPPDPLQNRLLGVEAVLRLEQMDGVLGLQHLGVRDDAAADGEAVHEVAAVGLHHEAVRDAPVVHAREPLARLLRRVRRRRGRRSTPSRRRCPRPRKASSWSDDSVTLPPVRRAVSRARSITPEASPNPSGRATRTSIPRRTAISSAELGTACGSAFGCGAHESTSFFPRGSPSVSVIAAASARAWHGCHFADSRLTTGRQSCHDGAERGVGPGRRCGPSARRRCGRRWRRRSARARRWPRWTCSAASPVMASLAPGEPPRALAGRDDDGRGAEVVRRQLHRSARAQARVEKQQRDGPASGGVGPRARLAEVKGSLKAGLPDLVGEVGPGGEMAHGREG